MRRTSSMKLCIAVCDDEQADRQEIVELTKEILLQENIDCTILAYGDGADLLSAMRSGMQFQILLLDVMMDDMNGMELAAAIREQENDVSIIFISSNREMAMQGYMVAASRYLSKPVDLKLLREALQFCSRTHLEQKEVLLKTADGQGRVLLNDIVYAEAYNRGVHLILSDGEMEVNMGLKVLANILPVPPFVFCHRTILVNLAYIRNIRYCEVDLSSGVSLPVSKYRYADVKKEFLHYLKAH